MRLSIWNNFGDTTFLILVPLRGFTYGLINRPSALRQHETNVWRLLAFQHFLHKWPYALSPSRNIISPLKPISGVFILHRLFVSIFTITIVSWAEKRPLPPEERIMQTTLQGQNGNWSHQQWIETFVFELSGCVSDHPETKTAPIERLHLEDRPPYIRSEFKYV